MGPYQTTSQGNAYAHTAICNLTGYLMTTPHTRQKDLNCSHTLIFGKKLLKFSFPRILHSDNGTEFKSKLIEHLTEQVSYQENLYFPHHPQSNRKLELPYIFLKDCIKIFN